MTRERKLELIHREGGGVTQEELDEGYHYCPDWDGLFLGPDSPGNIKSFCNCYPDGHPFYDNGQYSIQD